MDDLVVLKEFYNRHEAEMTKGLLDEKGIESYIKTDDCGGLRPGMSFGSSIKLMVRESDFEKAKEIIAVLSKDFNKDS